RIDGATGEIQIGTDPGVLGQIFTSQGPGVAPIWQSPAAAFPLLAPDGSCAAPSYSFATDPTSGLLYDVGVPAVTLEFDGCSSFVRVGDVVLIEANSGDFIEIGASITIATDASTPIVLSADTGDAVLTIHQDGEIRCATAAVERLRIDSVGAWQLAGVAGLAGQVITTNGPGLPPTWQAATTAFPLLAPDGSCLAPSYSFTSSPDSGMFYTGTAVRISDDNCGDYIEVGASINIIGATGAPGSGIDIFAGGAATALDMSGRLHISAGDVPTWFTAGFIDMSAAQGTIVSNITIHASDVIFVGPPLISQAGTVLVQGGGASTGVVFGGSVTVQGGFAGGPTNTGGLAEIVGGEALTLQAGDARMRGGVGPSAAASGDITFFTGALPQTLRMSIDRLGAGSFFGTFGAGALFGSTTVSAGVSMTTPGLTVTANAGLKASSQVDGAGASVGTLTNAPSAGNPTFWVPWFVNGIMRHVPAW
ncbi:MAG: hypothetical protein ACREVF_08115, partial [Burkholderiales bacterium]